MNNKTEVQLDFVNDQIKQEHEQRLLKQKALSVINPINKLSMLEMTKALHPVVNFCDQSRVIHHTLLKCMGYASMTEKQKQAIIDYLNN